MVKNEDELELYFLGLFREFYGRKIEFKFEVNYLSI